MRPNGLHSEVLQTAMEEAGMWIWKFRDPKSHALLFQTAMHPVIINCHRLLCIQLSSIQTFKPTGRPVGVPIQKETANVDDNNTNQQATSNNQQPTSNNQPYHFSSKQTKPWRQHRRRHVAVLGRLLLVPLRWIIAALRIPQSHRIRRWLPQGRGDLLTLLIWT